MNNFDIELEKLIIGCILVFRESIYTVMEYLKVGHFYHESHNVIYNAILCLNTDSKPIDSTTVCIKLKEQNKLEEVGGAYYIATLSKNITTSHNLQFNCIVVFEMFLKREMSHKLTTYANTINSNNQSDIFELYNNLGTELSSLFELSLSSDYSQMYEVINSRLIEIEKIKIEENGILGIDTGFSKLNNITNGFQPADYIILAARPSMGKTIISIICMLAAIFRQNKNVLFFSLEMSKERISDRILSLLTNIDSKIISSNRLNENEWKLITDQLDRLIDKNLFIFDQSGLTIEDITARAITLHRKHRIDLIVIDYIQLIRHSKPKSNTNDNVTHISKNIKALCKKINCPIIALSQMNRDTSGLPTMKNLRDSGSLEQDADIIWLLHREDYEGIECDPSEKERIDNLIVKNRNGNIEAFYTHRSTDWSYIGEIEYSEFKSLELPF